ncbi:MAG: large-conductance mechanosensitive channel protein MscL [Clostridiales bacterium]|nr:large-conductance mechanosensitive channel protein MscL [Clostridiales bacterium]
MKNKSKGIIAEFKEFITRGNVIDLAVGIIVGSSFTAIVNSLVADIIMPFIGWIIGDIDFSDLKIVLLKATETKGEVAIRYGLFIQKALEFLIIALVVFLVVKIINRLRRTIKNGLLNPQSNEQEPAQK